MKEYPKRGPKGTPKIPQERSERRLQVPKGDQERNEEGTKAYPKKNPWETSRKTLRETQKKTPSET